MRPRVHVELVTELRALVALRADFDRLLAVTPLASAFQSLAWLESCRAIPADGDGALFALVVRAGSEVIGILPTELGRGGGLRFVGETVSNYSGPVYAPEHVAGFASACAGFVWSERRVSLLDLGGLREGSPFLTALCGHELPGWSSATEVQTAVCPSLDLSPGWDALYARRKGKQRANFARKWDALERLGRLAYVEVSHPSDAIARLPALFDLFAGRWQGRHESGGFAGRRRRFQERAIGALAEAGHLRLSVLELDARVIAFSYGVWGAAGTTSYVLAHDDRLNVYSPGALLLLRVLQSACARGDQEYDFSIGVEAYKDRWATESRRVFRVLRWRHHTRAALVARAHAAGTRAWTAARSVSWLRDLRREGLRQLILPTSGTPSLPDVPGLAAGNGSTWHVYRVAAANTADAHVSHRTLSYEEMSRRLSPRLLDLAMDRGFRGDELVALSEDERPVGVAWRASAGRHALVTGGLEVPAKVPVFYHPVATADRDLASLLRVIPRLADGAAEALVVTPRLLPELAPSPLHSFAADHRFQVLQTPGT
ncbi:MAG: GNAT family N-acetyltransferase [Pseudomonadota bacterium]|nr:GNAT family N-acetyltransferase [Pseudomonadota bacterium]